MISLQDGIIRNKNVTINKLLFSTFEKIFIFLLRILHIADYVIPLLLVIILFFLNKYGLEENNYDIILVGIYIMMIFLKFILEYFIIKKGQENQSLWILKNKHPKQIFNFIFRLIFLGVIYYFETDNGMIYIISAIVFFSSFREILIPSYNYFIENGRLHFKTILRKSFVVSELKKISFTKSNDLLFFDGSNTYITSIQKETALKLIEKLLEMNPKLNIPDE